MKITKATVKSFIKQYKFNLYVKVISSFSGMIDCVSLIDDSFEKIEVKEIKNNYDEHTQGVDGLWFVGSSRDYFTIYEDSNYIGFEIYNSCGSSIVATKKIK